MITIITIMFDNLQHVIIVYIDIVTCNDKERPGSVCYFFFTLEQRSLYQPLLVILISMAF